MFEIRDNFSIDNVLIRAAWQDLHSLDPGQYFLIPKSKVASARAQIWRLTQVGQNQNNAPKYPDRKFEVKKVSKTEWAVVRVS